MRTVFGWRLDERLGYRAIADRLNRDLAIHPPPVPVNPARAAGRWTGSSVREVLTNPKHTGHMVWNQRARKSGGNVRNPVAQWVWSPRPVHEALVGLDTFIAVQEIGSRDHGSESSASVIRR